MRSASDCLLLIYCLFDRILQSCFPLPGSCGKTQELFLNCHVCGQFQVFLNFPHCLLYFHWFQVYSSNFLFLTTDPYSQMKSTIWNYSLEKVKCSITLQYKTPPNLGLFCVMGKFGVFSKRTKHRYEFIKEVFEIS